MRLRLGRLTLLALVLDGTDPARAQEAESAAPAIVVPVRAERVEVDLVVRDKRGGLVRDLRADEVEVFEDGVRQEVESLAFVEQGPGTELGVFAIDRGLSALQPSPTTSRWCAARSRP